jgi:iron complex outermembrane receptor protein
MQISGRGQNSGRGASKLRLLAAAGGAALLAGASAASAQDSGAAAKDSDAVSEVVVTGYRYLSEDTSGTTGLPLRIEEVPQAISLVNKDFIKAADLKSLGEVAQYTPGALYAGNPEGFGTVVKLRGFTAGTAIDGLAVGALDYDPDYATVERLEIVKGPSSVVYGAQSPGGLVNIVSKSARTSARNYVEALAGSWGRWRLEGQVSGALNASGSVRAIGIAAHEDADSFIDRMSSSKSVVFGGVDADLLPGLKGYAHAGYERFRRTSFDGVPTLADGSPAPVDRSFFIGSSDFNLTTTVKRFNSGLDWEATPNLSVALKANYQDTDTHGPAAYGFDLQDNGDFSIQVQNFLKNRREDINFGLSSVYKLDDAGLEGSFLSFAAIYRRTTLETLGSLPDFPAGGTAQANIFDGVRAIEAVVNTAIFPGFTYSYRQHLEYVTVSGQADVKVSDKVTLLGGISWSKPKTTTTLDGVSSDFSADGQVSYRAAVTVEPIEGLNVYLSYAESFNPQLKIDVAGRVLPPLSGKQYELGVKYVTPDRRLLLTGALFQVRQANQSVFDKVGLDGTDRYRAVGEVQHRGLELEALGRITDKWQVNAGLSLMDPTIRKDKNPAMVGKTETYLPERTASLYTSYNVTEAFFVAGGVRYVGKVRTSFDGSTRDLPAYSLADASMGYDFGKVRVQLNLKNLFDKRYYINNYQTLLYGNVVGEPRSVTVSLRADF